MEQTFFYGKDILTVQKAVALAQKKVTGVIGPDTRSSIQQSQRYVQKMASEGQTVYGITTGFGILANTKISEEDTATLQYKFCKATVWEWGIPLPKKWCGL
jgi:histidine ammonia-lyase